MLTWPLRPSARLRRGAELGSEGSHTWGWGVKPGLEEETEEGKGTQGTRYQRQRTAIPKDCVLCTACHLALAWPSDLLLRGITVKIIVFLSWNGLGASCHFTGFRSTKLVAEGLPSVVSHHQRPHGSASQTRQQTCTGGEELPPGRTEGEETLLTSPGALGQSHHWSSRLRAHPIQPPAFLPGKHSVQCAVQEGEENNRESILLQTNPRAKHSFLRMKNPLLHPVGAHKSSP
ncbi:uncharacterized protein LOC117013338 isoform X2 [Rhinolophus ferrumequinum]|uniref:uncharacterized protein LOC117013338 isoform X2 n=1 Tax=Rhinolophus ferrumequinum TaxID=59479 RepID=UPI00140F89FC|nr:uncharacterized protein LOC117013338 isoform X2 [Rhinolophus ferrumequinum]